MLISALQRNEKFSTIFKKKDDFYWFQNQTNAWKNYL